MVEKINLENKLSELKEFGSCFIRNNLFCPKIISWHGGDLFPEPGAKYGLLTGIIDTFGAGIYGFLNNSKPDEVVAYAIGGFLYSIISQYAGMGIVNVVDSIKNKKREINLIKESK